MRSIRQWSLPAKMFTGLAIVVVVGYLGGCLGRTDITGDEAVRIARAQIDFEPEQINAELGRQGFPPKPVWAVTFWIAAKDGVGGFERRTAVEVNADTGEVLNILNDP
jgi:hypothetical protein|tara:strand:- start:127 stop:450 length:324 start_codon:yes stop_codon:yes gene_type:complete